MSQHSWNLSDINREITKLLYKEKRIETGLPQKKKKSFFSFPPFLTQNKRIM